jgi:hypothetical protein
LIRRLAGAAAVALAIRAFQSPAGAADLERVDVEGSLHCSSSGRHEDAKPGKNALVLLKGFTYSSNLVNERGFFRLIADTQIVEQNVYLMYHLTPGTAVPFPHFVGKGQIHPESGVKVIRFSTPDLVTFDNCQGIDGFKSGVIANEAKEADHTGWWGPGVQAGVRSVILFALHAPMSDGPANRTEVKPNLPLQSVLGGSAEGAYLHRARSAHFLDPGFRITSVRNPSYLALTNPSALTFEAGSSIQTMGALGVGQPFDIAISAYFSRHGWAMSTAHIVHTEARPQSLTYEGGSTPIGFESQAFEQSLIFGVARRLGNRFSIGPMARLFLQSREVALSVTETTRYRNNVPQPPTTTVDSSYTHRFGATVGLTATFEPIPAVRIAVAGLDLLASRERFANGPGHNASADLGIASYLGRWHLGVDAQASSEFGFDTSAGINLRTTNWLDVALGLLSLERSARLSARVFGFTLSGRYATESANHWEINVGGSWNWSL